MRSLIILPILLLLKVQHVLIGRLVKRGVRR